MVLGYLEKLKMKSDPIFIQTYQAKSLLSVFAPVIENIGDISLKDWYIDYMKSTPAAALNLGGNFKPNKITLDASHFSLSPYQASQEFEMGRAERIIFEKSGMLPKGIEQLGTNVARTASFYLKRGTDANGVAFGSQYNFIDDAGTSTGAVNRGLMKTSSGSKWNHATNGYVNMDKDINTLAQQLRDINCNPATSIVLVPKIAMGSLEREWTANGGTTALAKLKSKFMAVIEVENDYGKTAAAADPTALLFDLIAIDLAWMKIGITFPEGIRYVEDNVNEKTIVRGEVQFCPAFYPIFVIESGTEKIYKSVSRVAAIDCSSTS